MDLEIEKRLRSFLSDMLNANAKQMVPNTFSTSEALLQSDTNESGTNELETHGSETHVSETHGSETDESDVSMAVNVQADVNAISEHEDSSTDASETDNSETHVSETDDSETHDSDPQSDAVDDEQTEITIGEPVTILDRDLKESAYYDYTVTHKAMDLEKLFDGLVTEYISGGKDMNAMLNEINQQMSGGGADENIVDGGSIEVEPVVEQNANPDYKIDEEQKEPTDNIKYNTEIEIIDLDEYKSMLEEKQTKNKLVGGKIKPSLAKYTELYPFVINY